MCADPSSISFAAGAHSVRTTFLPSVIALALGTWAGAAPAKAQTPVCPAGYYYASDGQCYPGAAPVYPPPIYEVAPPIYQPPVVIDGFGIGIGLGAIIGGGGRGRGGGGRSGGGHGHR
jgi:hypothetical protein